MKNFLGLVYVFATMAACGDDGGDSTPDARTVDAPPSNTPTRAVAYINRDTGLPTENQDVAVNSSCAQPDTTDAQPISATGMVNRNVHVDACLFGASGMDELDGQATFESSGVGFISACPDPDAIMGGANGPKTATNSDTNMDMRNDRCVQSGYQVKNMAGDNEFHARFNNDTGAGTQTVTFCLDTNGNGCTDETVKSEITINWTAM